MKLLLFALLINIVTGDDLPELKIHSEDYDIGITERVAADTTSKEDKVAADLAAYRSFLLMSEQIKLRASSQFSTIGADSACDFNSAVSSIQDVIDTGIPEVRVASNGTYQNNLSLVSQDVVIRGGFATCTEAENNDQLFSDLTVINGSSMAEPVIHITGSTERHVVRLENLGLTGGTSAAPKLGGGLSLQQANIELQLLRVMIAGNSGSTGAGFSSHAGIGSESTTTDVFGQDVLIFSNQANSSFGGGGGLYCVGNSSITLTGLSAIVNNEAAVGAGIYMRNGCEISFYSEHHPEELIGFSPGIVSNRSTGEGGGAFVTLGAELYLFGQRMCDQTTCLGSNADPVYVAFNNSGEDDLGNETGGGLYVEAGSEASVFFTEIYGNGLVIGGNQAGGHGGGAYIGSNARLKIDRVSSSCWNIDRCNLIIDNQSGISTGLGGAFYVDGGELELSHAYVEGNRADFGTAIYARGDTASVVIESSVFTRNGDEGVDGFADSQVFAASLGAALSIRHSTIADNNATISVFDIGVALDSSLSLFSSIVHDPSSNQIFGLISGPLDVNCVVVHEEASFNGTDIFVIDPGFVDRNAADFHLGMTSAAIDLCQDTTPLLHALDMDMQPRGWDDPQSNNTLGTYDAGADESYSNDVIFKNSFE